MNSRPLALGSIDLAAFYEVDRQRRERWSRRETLAFIILSNGVAYGVIITLGAMMLGVW